MFKRTNLLSLALLACILTACNDANDTPPANPTRTPTRVVMTTFYPTTYFAKRIAGDTLTITNPVPPDADPIFWQPNDAALSQYQDADLIIINGGEFEKWVANAALPRTRIVDTCANLPDPFITYESTTHSHGPEGEHSHEGIDGHTWLDPVTAMAQARAILTALKTTYPDDADTFSANAESLMRDLAALDTRLRTLAPRLREETTLLASHPAYNYLARRYNLEINNLDIDPDAPIPQALVTDLKDVLAVSSVNPKIIMLWEGNPIAANVEALNAVNIHSVWFSPAESLDPQASGQDYLTVMSSNLDRLIRALE